MDGWYERLAFSNQGIPPGTHRFISTPIKTVDKRLNSETAELKSDITALEKKLHYLETTHKNSREHIDQIFRSGGRA
jgi:prefoldin subunit 1